MLKCELRISLGAALLAAAVPALAQSNVTIYGLMDQGLERISAGGGWRVGSGTANPRLGFRGTEDMGGGLKSIFTLESGISVDTGTLGQGGRMFGRQAFVGVAGNFGTVSFGRQYTMRYFGILDADLFGAGSHGLGSLDSGIPNARADNAVNYRSPTWGGFSGGATYSLGRDVNSCAGETPVNHQCRLYAVMSKFDAGNWGVVASYERQHGGTGGSAGLTTVDKTDDRLMVNGYLTLGDSRFAVGWLRRNNEGNPFPNSTTPAATVAVTPLLPKPKSDLFWVVGSVPLASQFVLDAMLAELKFRDSKERALQLSVRGNYLLSKRTSIYLSGAFVDNSAGLNFTATTSTPASLPVKGKGQSSVIAGVRHVF